MTVLIAVSAVNQVGVHVCFGWADVIASILVPIKIGDTRCTVISRINASSTIFVTRIASLCSPVSEVALGTSG